MKSRFIVLMVLVFVTALFTGCATTGDLEKLQAQVKETSMKADQAAAKADMAAKRRRGGQVNGCNQPGRLCQGIRGL